LARSRSEPAWSARRSWGFDSPDMALDLDALKVDQAI
jgi:hypothetical protein